MSVDIKGHHIDGIYIAAILSLVYIAGVLGLKKYFAGGRCHLSPNLQGKNVVVTGGNTGIGKETAKRMIQLGARVVIGSRDTNKNSQTVKELGQIPKAKITAFYLDLGDRKSVE